MFERIPHSLLVVNVVRNPDHPNSWRTSQFTTGSERSKEPWLSSCLNEIHWNSNLLPVVINLRALDHPFKMVSGIQTTNQGYKQYSVYLKHMINLVYISNIWLIYFTTNLNMIDLVYISQIYDVYFTTNLNMINLVYTSQIYYDYISHQSCISHLNDKPDIYINIYIYIYIELIGTFAEACISSISSKV